MATLPHNQPIIPSKQRNVEDVVEQTETMDREGHWGGICRLQTSQWALRKNVKALINAMNEQKQFFKIPFLL